ncbi:helix-hairpin-helix domain-containing protein [Mangrovimonas aestuarii]|uniref:helix-hairpin-helix domain-containing protein n=1 Tax=Mangrovimonas aestuarii TaxID=3018443 RepID=UPI002378400A|nr:helix-hairpin-helix domain-containing protein [Mangrovimonas aestuarii]
MKSHFTFTKQQRNGIFLLLLLIVVFQLVYFFVGFTPATDEVNVTELKRVEAELDSLKAEALKEKAIKIYPFNPNFVTDYKGYTLGMSIEEIDRLHAYRDQGKWVNSVEEFQRVTQVSDSLLKIISPYIKFPDFVKESKSIAKYKNKPSLEKTFKEKFDLNKVTALQLQRVNGVGEVLSERIVRFRDKFPGGFIADVQLQDVYGLSPDVISRVTQQFTVKTPRQIKKVNINTASADSLVLVQHIDYDLAYNIVEERKLREGFKSLEELTKVKDFPVKKIEIIKLYLSLD